jgi:AmiR/NasT family two-component response regulator
VVLEQAKGVLSYSGDLDMSAAFAALRSYARDHNIKLTELARAVVNRALPVALVLDHVQTRRGTGSP